MSLEGRKSDIRNTHMKHVRKEYQVIYFGSPVAAALGTTDTNGKRSFLGDLPY